MFWASDFSSNLSFSAIPDNLNTHTYLCKFGVQDFGLKYCNFPNPRVQLKEYYAKEDTHRFVPNFFAYHTLALSFHHSDIDSVPYEINKLVPNKSNEAFGTAVVGLGILSNSWRTTCKKCVSLFDNL